jgi:hypothetical protein
MADFMNPYPPKRARNGGFSMKASKVPGCGVQGLKEQWSYGRAGDWDFGMGNAPAFPSSVAGLLRRTGAFTSYGAARRTKELSRKCEIRENTKKD